MLVTDGSYKFLGLKQSKKRSGEGFWEFVCLADAGKYENYDFIVPESSSLDTSSLVIGDMVKATFDLGLYQGRPSITIVALTKTKDLVPSK